MRSVALETRERTISSGETRAWSPEMEILLLCCRASHAPGVDGAPVRRLLENGVDWEALMRLALWHKLAPLLYENHREVLASYAPADSMTRLREACVLNAQRSLRMTSELLEILTEFEKDGIVAVPYKGPVLGKRLYGDLALRMSSDLDILVRRRDIERAERVLHGRGYRPGHAVAERNRPFMLESRYSERFQGKDGLEVELHWAFTNKDVAFPISLDDLLPRLEQLDLGNRKVWLLPLEDLLLILCVHGAKHRWDRLEWLHGVGELLSRWEPRNWDVVLERARAFRCEGSLLLGLALVDDLCRVELPEQVRRRIRLDGRVAELAEAVKDLLREGVPDPGASGEGDLAHDLFHLKLRDRNLDRIRYILYRITTPSRPERWSALSIRGTTLPLHSFLRPIQLTLKLPTILWRSWVSRFRTKRIRDDRTIG